MLVRPIRIDEDGGIDRRKDGIDVLLLLLHYLLPHLPIKLILVSLLPNLFIPLVMTHDLRVLLLVVIHSRPLPLRQRFELRNK
jgi:hypothetical protein